MGLFGRKSADVLDDASPEDEPAPKPALHAGVPGRCPRCGGFGYIDHIDMKHRTQTQHCRDCRHSWEFSFDEMGDVIDVTDDALAERSESNSR